MKLVILAGGYGKRLGQISNSIPKPMVEIGGKPILWHIMKIYSHYGINEFVICLGYKAQVIKDYFINYDIRNNDFTIDIGLNAITFHSKQEEYGWKVTLIDTGLNSLKGARLKKIEKYLEDETNLLTYADGLADIDIWKLIDFHSKQNKMVTLSGVYPPMQFGELITEEDKLIAFNEKALKAGYLINGGYMVFNRSLFNVLTEDEDCDLEYGTFERLAKLGEIAVYKHTGQWVCMDSERDVEKLNKMWKEQHAFWKVWG